MFFIRIIPPGTQLDKEHRTPTLSEMAEEEQDPTEIVREECKQTKCAKAWADYHEVRSPHFPRPARARRMHEPVDIRHVVLCSQPRPVHTRRRHRTRAGPLPKPALRCARARGGRGCAPEDGGGRKNG
eukprot:COSAG01_NODE_9355_length_2471_cov_23.244941_2_plen_128_part_00